MTEYRPHLPDDRWAQLKPFVDAAVADSAGLTAYSARELYAAITPLAHWIVYRVALPLDRDVAFDPHTIDRFCVEGLAHYTKAGRGTMRSRLRRVAEALLPETDEPPRERPLGPSIANAPYTEAEISNLWGWAFALPTLASIHAMRLLSLGLGAGLLGGEIGRVRIRDLMVGDLGVAIRVLGGRSRAVPVLQEYERPLVDAANSERPAGWVFREGRDTQNRNLVTDFAARHPPPVQLQARKMRATWIVHHLNSGAPLLALLTASGLAHAEGLDRFLQFTHRESSSCCELR